MKTIKEIINDYKYEKYELSTGFSALDENFMIRLSEVTVIASRPGMGENSLVLSIISNIVNNGMSAYIISNDTNNNILKKLISANSNFKLCDLRDKDLKSDSKIINVLENLKKKNIYINNTYTNDIFNKIDEIREIKNKDKDLKVVLVEYPLDDDIIKYRKLARELDIAIIILSELSKKLENRDDKRPLMKDLSFDIFKNADNVLLIYREDYYRVTNEQKSIVEIYLIKSIDGLCCTLYLIYNHETMKIEDISKSELETTIKCKKNAL